MVGVHVGPEVGVEEKIRALEEVLRSDTFSRTERLKGLLRFLGEAGIEGRGSDLTEYTIGVMALGRPQEFCPLEDSSVRSRVHELRQRLEKYYTLEAPSAPVRIELRKGSYAPRFCSAHGDDDAPAATLAGPSDLIPFSPAAPLAEPAPALPKRRRVWVTSLVFIAGAATMFAALAVWSAFMKPGARVPATRLESTAGTPWTPELETLWRPFFAGGTPLLIAFETRFFVRMGPLMVRDWRINGPEGVGSSESLMRVQSLLGFSRYGNRDYADGGTPQAIFSLSRLLSTRIPNMSLRNSLDVTAADYRDNNVILLGKPGMDPEVERILSRAELVDLGGIVRNLRPAAGEQAEYRDQSDSTNPDRWAQKYSVITMMPGLAGNKRILTLTASGSEQPAALAYYMTNPDTARDLVRRTRSANATSSDYFQVLVRAEYKMKSVVKVEYVTHRVLKAR